LNPFICNPEKPDKQGLFISRKYESIIPLKVESKILKKRKFSNEVRDKSREFFVLYMFEIAETEIEGLKRGKKKIKFELGLYTRFVSER